MRLMCSSLFLVVPMLLVSSRTEAAQAPSDDEAIKKVINANAAAKKKLEWSEQVKWMHPEALDEFKDGLMPALKAAAERSPEVQKGVLQLFDGATDLKAVMELKPAEFYVRYLKAVTSRIPPERKEAMAGSDYEVIGVVYEKKGMAHAVVRVKVKIQNIEVSKMEVVSLKPSGSEWRIMLSGDGKEAAEALRRWIQK